MYIATYFISTCLFKNIIGTYVCIWPQALQIKMLKQPLRSLFCINIGVRLLPFPVISLAQFSSQENKQPKGAKLRHLQHMMTVPGENQLRIHLFNGDHNFLGTMSKSQARKMAFNQELLLRDDLSDGEIEALRKMNPNLDETLPICTILNKAERLVRNETMQQERREKKEHRISGRHLIKYLTWVLLIDILIYPSYIVHT